MLLKIIWLYHWLSIGIQKEPKSDFESKFLMSKFIWIFLIYFSSNNIILGKVSFLNLDMIFEQEPTLSWPLLWQYGLWSFQTGGTKLERFLLKNQNTQRKLLKFENLVNGEISKSANIDFQSQFSMSKIIRISQVFFLLKNINLGAHFLSLTFFDSINF